jgi:hypothetical protein
LSEIITEQKRGGKRRTEAKYLHSTRPELVEGRRFDEFSARLLNGVALIPQSNVEQWN